MPTNSTTATPKPRHDCQSLTQRGQSEHGNATEHRQSESTQVVRGRERIVDLAEQNGNRQAAAHNPPTARRSAAPSGSAPPATAALRADRRSAASPCPPGYRPPGRCWRTATAAAIPRSSCAALHNRGRYSRIPRPGLAAPAGSFPACRGTPRRRRAVAASRTPACRRRSALP